MKVEGPKLAPVRAARPVERVRGSTSATEGRHIADTTAILGIPEAELTPKVRAAIMGLMEEVAALRDELRRSHQRIEYLERLADQDSLLPVHNRRAFVRELTRVISIAERYGTPSTVLYFDVVGMKAINDRLGHAAGDLALRRVADVLAEQVRESDIVGRLGGDEFGVILFRADETVGLQKAHQLVDAIGAEPVQYNDETFPMSVSFGAHTFTGREDADAALEAADQAMYARRRGESGSS